MKSIALSQIAAITFTSGGWAADIGRSFATTEMGARQSLPVASRKTSLSAMVNAVTLNWRVLG